MMVFYTDAKTSRQEERLDRLTLDFLGRRAQSVFVFPIVSSATLGTSFFQPINRSTSRAVVVAVANLS